jgi:hypothetical protein
MFGVDFGGCTGHREVRVEDTRIDSCRQLFGGSTQRTLSFEDTQPWRSEGPPAPCNKGKALAYPPSGSDGAGPSTMATEAPSPFLSWRPLSPTYNSEEDDDWRGEFEDF